MSQPVRPPDGRYGPAPSPGRRRAARIALVAAAAALVALVLWLGIGAARTPVRWKDVGFVLDGPTAVDATFEVITDPGTTVACRVRALSASYAEVGVTTVQVPPADDRTRRITVRVPTAELAVSTVVDTCEVVED